MADTRFGKKEHELDWENLSAPVPMDLIDPEFPAHPPAAPAPADGAASAILPREESDALARDAAAGTAGVAPADPDPGPAGAFPSPVDPAADPRATLAGGTLFGTDAGTESLQDEFARIRAEMEAEAEAEKNRKLEAEREEAAQRERLEQWMANARARLLKADADLTGPAGRVRIRRESSPSLYRLAEMQKTMDLSGEPTVPGGTRSLLAPAAPDPMATISVPADQFLTLDAPPRTDRMAQAPPSPAPPPAAQPPVAPLFTEDSPSAGAVPSAAMERAFPSRSAETPYESGPIPLISPSSDATAYRPMTREEALTRKVAKLRQAAETGENTLVRSPLYDNEGEGRALNIAIAAVVLVAILVLGLGLFAATQAGLFDGLENRIPFLKPRMAMVPAPSGKGPLAPSTAAPAPVPASAIPAAAATSPAAAARPASAPVPASPGLPAAAPAAPRNDAVTSRAAAKAAPRPSPAGPTAAKPAAKAAGKARKPAAEPEEEIPAYARARPAAPARAETLLRNAVEAAAAMDQDNLRELYNRYAMGFPGLSGEVVIGLTVDPSGRILEGSVVSSTTGVTTFDQDLLRKVVLWRLGSFPETRPKFISVPFLFPMQGR